MRRRGFTLIEILVVVAIIGILTAGALTTLVSGRAAAHARDASRGVAQMTHYAAALALLRQRPAVLSYAGSTITVQLSGKAQDVSEVGAPARPIYEEVNGEAAVEPETVVDAAEEEASGGGGKGVAERTGLFFTRQVLDPEELAKEDAERTFEGVTFTLELLDDDGRELDEETGNRIRSKADTLAGTRGPISGWSNVRGELDVEGEGKEREAARPQRVVFETNGNCTPHRVVLREVRDEDGASGEEDGPELMAVNVSRSGKVTISSGAGDDGAARRRASGRGRRGRR